MKKKIITLFFVLLSIQLYLQAEYSIVYIHIGRKIPSYASIAISQARLFNPNAKIILLANEGPLGEFLSAYPELDFVPITAESLAITKEHQIFQKKSTIDSTFRDGFWKYTSERFLYLYDLMEQHNLTDVFHIEYDNMLYVNIEELLPIFHKYYPGIGAIFENDNRCVPNFIYLRSKSEMKELAACFSLCASTAQSDMEIIAFYKNTNRRSKIEYLPIIMKEYVKKNSLITPQGKKAANKQKYCFLCDEFNSIFDGAALGQYLGGIDPRNGPSVPGHIDIFCVFNASYLQFDWREDSLGRKVPYATYGNKSYRINNLHIHSKKLENFKSL